MTQSNSRRRWTDYVLLGASVFLLFCLIFEPYIELPNLVAWLGRWHPLVLHFPIVLLLLAVFFGLTGRGVSRTLLLVASLLALFTAISGFFLGMEAGVKGNLLLWHQRLGSATAFLAVTWYYLDRKGLEKKQYTKGLQLILAAVIIFTAHYGGMVTHGENFLALPTKERDAMLPANPKVYQDVVSSIVDDKCVKCHNPNKRKGELLMTGFTEMMKGGEGGPIISKGDAENSELFRRLHLPIDDEKHMPPEGETPLEESEIAILERWIALGASDTLMLTHLDNDEPLRAYIQEMMRPDPMEKWKSLPAVADSTLNRLSSDYLTLRRMAGGTNALSVNMYLPPIYDASILEQLRPIAENIIEMDLSGLPLGQTEMNLLASCKNLEWLELDRSPIGDLEVDTLKVLKKVRLLKIYETDIGDKSLEVIRAMEGLKQLYLWNTKISAEALNQFKTSNSTLFVNSGIDQELQTLFAVKDSITKN